jgi:tetratricopeptide (TPR) repeat protein
LTDLIHQGWNHLKHQRPLAAWASWQRALRANPGSVVVKKALSAFDSATELPSSARKSYRLREPIDRSRRAQWDQTLTASSAASLEASADLFGRLAALDPADPAAWYNRALCLAWSGANREAIACLDRVVNLEAAQSLDKAVEAWTLAEVLRQGAGAEMLADDLRFACTIAWQPADTACLLAEFPEIVKVPTPTAPGDLPGETHPIEVFEWLDRPAAEIDFTQQYSSAADLPIVLATVFISPTTLRLSSPRAETLERIEEILFQRLDPGDRSIRREASPLPFAFLDADLWIVRIPPGVDSVLKDDLQREAVERYFENIWIHRPRHGLDERSSLEAARLASSGDPVARAKLTAVVRLREQLGGRPSARMLYQGYPFDRLRRRLGLELVDSVAVDSADLTCAPPDEVDRLDPASLDDPRIADAVASAVGLKDDTRTARLAAELIRRQPASITAVDLPSVVSPLVRQSLSRGDHDGALDWITRAISIAHPRAATTLGVWRAEVLARAGRPKEALGAYRALITPDASGAALALDAGETMLDNRHRQEAQSLFTTARDLARRAGRRWTEQRANQFLEQVS